MNIQALSDLFSELTGDKIYNLQFPEDEFGEAIKVETTSGIIEKGGIKDFNIQFMTKAGHPAVAERLSLGLINNLHMVTNKEFGNGKYQLVLCSCQAPTPNFVGELVNGEFVYSVDFRLLVAEI